jgi:hypothetical protein
MKPYTLTYNDFPPAFVTFASLPIGAFFRYGNHIYWKVKGITSNGALNLDTAEVVPFAADKTVRVLTPPFAVTIRAVKP